MHIQDKIKVKYDHSSEKYFVCYGEEMSIIISYKKYDVSDGDFTVYAVTMQYVDTDSYDWGYLDSRIN